MPSDGQVIWVEVLTRQGEVLTRYRARCGTGGDEVRLGRGYENDVILDDPFVAAHHLRIARDESGALFAHDLSSANGLFTGHDRRRRERVALDPNQPIRIGRTFLRVRQADYAVPAEQIAMQRARTWPLLLGLAAALF